VTFQVFSRILCSITGADADADAAVGRAEVSRAQRSGTRTWQSDADAEVAAGAALLEVAAWTLPWRPRWGR
jgi:hypothetical protein